MPYGALAVGSNIKKGESNVASKTPVIKIIKEREKGMDTRRGAHLYTAIAEQTRKTRLTSMAEHKKKSG